MLQQSLLVGLVLWAATTVAYAEIYSWTDDHGTVHFTEDAGAVPAAQRKRIRSDKENGTVVTETAPTPQAAEEERQARPAQEEYNGETDEWSLDQWLQELQKREAAMVEIRKQLDELADKAGKTPAGSNERQKLVAAHGALLLRYNDMKAGYFQLVEAARKAGFTVEMQQ